MKKTECPAHGTDYNETCTRCDDCMKQDRRYCDKCEAIYGDGHDCDNCDYCGTADQ